MFYKITMLFQESTAVSNPGLPTRRIGGWSESWYTAQNSASAAIALALAPGGIGGFGVGLFPGRAALLPLGAAIVGGRVQQVSPVGLAQSFAANYPGNAAVQADIPQMALLCKAGSQTSTNVRRFTLRGIPDVYIIEGEYQPTAAFNQAVNLFLVNLGAWQFRGRDLSQPRNPIVNVLATGQINFVGPTPYAVGNMIRVGRSKDANGIQRGGVFQVATVSGGGATVTVSNWNFGPTTGGYARLEGVVYPFVDTTNIGVVRAVTRRVGRPFTSYRGRRSKRH